MKIDALNIAIIKHLKEGRKAYKLIADDLSISENTVRARVNKMRSAGILEIAGLVDPAAIPGHSTVIIGVKLKSTDLVNMGKEFSKLRGVISVAVVTGRYDLMLVAVFNESFGLLEFYTEEIARLEGVLALETFVIYKSYNLKVPYKL